jgi:hypothetical protein
MALLLILIPSLGLLVLTRLWGLKRPWAGAVVAATAFLQAVIIAVYLSVLERPMTP